MVDDSFAMRPVPVWSKYESGFVCWRFRVLGEIRGMI
jgi:hypothetical protein